MTRCGFDMGPVCSQNTDLGVTSSTKDDTEKAPVKGWEEGTQGQ